MTIGVNFSVNFPETLQLLLNLEKAEVVEDELSGNLPFIQQLLMIYKQG